ncbi:MAG: hypothetical protein HGA19_16805 [Oscillochloris sp.]|nr:hypothetical protein [Oscillochloris sp.]
MSMKTANHWDVTGLDMNGSSVSFEDIGADLHALYSGGTVNVRTLAVDLQGLYGDVLLPINRSDLLGEIHELYGDADVSWADFSKDFEALYTIHAV